MSPWEESAETRTKEEGEPSKLRKTEVAQMKGSPVGNNFNRDTKRMCVSGHVEAARGDLSRVHPNIRTLNRVARSSRSEGPEPFVLGKTIGEERKVWKVVLWREIGGRK